MSDFLSTTVTTELEAVNVMFQNIGESPVNSLNAPANNQLGLAKAVLSEVNREVQTEGWWFNTESKYPLAAETNGNVQVPNNTLHLEISDPKHDRVLVQRGSRLYDTMNHTYSIGETVKVDAIFLLPFDELPQTARSYIAIRAARRFQVQQTRSRIFSALTQEQEMLARRELMRAHLNASKPTVREAEPIRRVVAPHIRRPVP